MLRFLHVADLHLGLRITRFDGTAIDRIREARFAALERIRDEVDPSEAGDQFVIIAGDLFDDVRVSRSISNRTFKLLESFSVPVLLIPGNHDPYEPGSLWEMPPWDGTSNQRVQLLCERQPFTGIEGVTILPCPVFRKRSADDPTRWIADHPRTDDDGFRIGIAHGSVMDRPDLPTDDHPISPSAPTDLDLDYLALGHWHGQKLYTSDASAVRMAYPGVHEPMRFRDDSRVAGWQPYSSGTDREEFLDTGDGTALRVTIEKPGATPTVESVNVQHFRWRSRTEHVTNEAEFDAILQRVAEQENYERMLLKLKLTGTLPVGVLHRVEELRDVLGRYAVSELDDEELTVEPTSEEVREIIGTGVLGQVHQRLQELSQTASPDTDPAVIEHATRVLYKLAAKVK
ncbi:metallophosphoesterase family protein [Thalassoroseus pseudoceratinae]|uniref:metallophosphoesterase family protein n=1 Tax=Thalassoroseus pseudoceratinae TaxID=2713176 RepID=UPI001424138D|nr:DNA repair exonuclease [Thalassoroseus pseudoceratinae]